MDKYVTVHPINKDKYAVAFYIGECTSIKEAEELAEKVGPILSDAVDKLLR